MVRSRARVRTSRTLNCSTPANSIRRPRPRLQLAELEVRSTPSVSLVKDINSQPGDRLESTPDQLLNINGVVYFVADDGTHGRELWKSDGTAEGTVLVKDIFPGTTIAYGQTVASSSAPSDFAALGDTLYFVADDGIHGRELWKSDGTETGTVLVMEIDVGQPGSFPRTITSHNAAVYFTTYGGLWKTDGTEAGTLRLSPESGLYVSTGLHALNGELYFGASGDLWKTDGTVGGTAQVVDLAGSGIPSVPSYALKDNAWAKFNNVLYFAANDGVAGNELWRSDGTATGTFLVKDISTGTGASSNPTRLTTMGNTLYFVATNSTNGTKIWKSDGTAAGTTVVLGAGGSGNYSFYDGNLRVLDNTLYFTAGELWKTGEASSVAVRVKPANQGGPTSLRQLTVVGNRLFFSADASGGPELWKSDGTAAGTVVVKDITPSYNGSFDYSVQPNFTAVGDSLFFVPHAPVGGRELWRSDGTDVGTVLIKDINASTSPSNPESLTELNDRVLFTADDGQTGRELWTSGGTDTNTTRLIDIRTGAVGSDPKELTRVGDTVYFTADDGINGPALWKTDGTDDGTSMVVDLVPDTSQYYGPKNLVEFRGELYFSIDYSNGTDGSLIGLWKTDGTATGTVHVSRVQIWQPPTVFKDALYFGGQVYIPGIVETEVGVELWKTDGTDAGTSLVKDIYPGTYGDSEFRDYNSSSPTNLTVVGNTLFFSAISSAGRELWKTDGTRAGTKLVRDIFPGSAYDDGMMRVMPRDSNPSYLTAFNGLVYFAAENGTNGQELWRSDGTAAGTFAIDLAPGGFIDMGHFSPNGSGPKGLTAVGPRLLFTAYVMDFPTPGYWGLTLWGSDGMAAGTAPIYPPNKFISDLETFYATGPLTVSGNQVLFTASTPALGKELWVMPLAPVVTTSTSNIVFSEGAPGSVIGTFSHPLGATLTLTASSGTVVPDAVTGTWTWTLPATDGPQAPVEVTITVTDTHARVATTTFTYSVVDVPPSTTLKANHVSQVNSTFALEVGAVLDPGVDPITAFIIDWGDGQSTNGSSNPGNQAFEHTYTVEGTYSVALTLTNDDGDFIVGSHTITVSRALITSLLAAPGGQRVGNILTAPNGVANRADLAGTADAAGLLLHVFDGQNELGTTTSQSGPEGATWTFGTEGLVEGWHSFTILVDGSTVASPTVTVSAAVTKLVPGIEILEDGPAKIFNVAALLDFADYADADGGRRGIAILGLDGLGSWQYKFGARWVPIVDVSETNSLLLSDTDILRYVPAKDDDSLGAITFRGWDRTTGTQYGYLDEGQFLMIEGSTLSNETATAFLDILPVNDRPTLTTGELIALPSVAPDESDPEGATVENLFGDLISDVDGPAAGVVLTGASSPGGTWQYDAGDGWTNVGVLGRNRAVALGLDAKLRFLPGTQKGKATLTVKAWDQSTAAVDHIVTRTTDNSFSTQSASLQILIGPSRPQVAGTPADFPSLNEDPITNLGTPVGNLIAPLSWTDADVVPPARVIKGIAVTGTTGAFGVWQFKSGSSWIDIGNVSQANALLLDDKSRIRFVPKPGESGTATLRFLAWDRSAGQVGNRADTTSGAIEAFGASEFSVNLEVLPVNDRPVLDTTGTPIFPAIAGSTGETITTVAALLGDAVTDDGPFEGIAVTGFNSAAGVWSYDDGTGFKPIPSVSEQSVLLLPASTPLRWTANDAGTASLTYRAWDGAGGTNAFEFADSKLLSISLESESAFASAGSTQPEFDGLGPVRLAKIAEDTRSPNPIGLTALIETIVGTPADQSHGVAIVEARGNGVWEYRLTPNSAWLKLTDATPANALLLPGSASVRFTPAANWNGTAALVARARDQSIGIGGDRADVTGDSGAFGATTREGWVEVTPVADRPKVNSHAVVWRNVPIGYSASLDMGALLQALQASDPDGAIFNGGIAVTAVGRPGSWMLGDQAISIPPGRALLLNVSEMVEFIPVSGFKGTVTLTFKIWDGTPSETTLVSANFAGLSIEVGKLSIIVGNASPTLGVVT